MYPFSDTTWKSDGYHRDKRTTVWKFPRDKEGIFSRLSLDFYRKWVEKHKPHGKEACFRTGQSLFFFLQPTTQLSARIQLERQKLNLANGERYVSIHVRHGDKYLEHGLRTGLDAYMKKLWQVFPGVRHVHLMTEDAQVVKDQEQFPNVTF